LKRAIQHQLENPLAQQLLTGEYASGDVIRIDVKDGDITFGKLQTVKAAV
jgi:ATP-dependent Clp protease ATP-binding subunit ClpB